MLKTTSGEQTRYRALTRPFSLSEAEYAEMGVACETRVEVQHLWECRSIYIYIYTARKTQRVATFVILLHPKQQELCLYIIWGRGRVWATKCQLFSDTFGSHNS